MKPTSLILLSVLTGGAGIISAQLVDPIPERIQPGGLVLPLEDWLQVPASGPAPKLARISVVKPAFDGSGRIFVADLRGPMHVIDGDRRELYTDVAQAFPDFIDEPQLGSGFHAFAFHPEFPTNGRFYTVHTEPGGSGDLDFGPVVDLEVTIESVVTEWITSDPTANTFSGSRREILRVGYPTDLHNFQEIAFNHFVDRTHEDYGLLYVCVGDGGAVNVDPTLAHRLDSVYGTLLRIDPSGTDSGNGQYGIPSTNPFVAQRADGTLGEIYAWGFRNPHRVCWDPAAPDRMFLADIGQANIEEINLVVKGGDYGWWAREGTFRLDPTVDDSVVWPLPPNDAEFGYQYPVAQYDHDEGFAVTLGFVYRGYQQPLLDGLLLFGDIVNGRVFYVEADELAAGSPATIQELLFEHDGTAQSLLEIMGDTRADLRFGLSEDGEIFLTTKRDGFIHRFTPSAENGSGDLANISTRGTVQTGDGIMVGGFVVTDEARRVLIRGLGPTLADLDVAGALADPRITVFDNLGQEIAFNDDWSAQPYADAVISAGATAGAYPLVEGSADAALVLYLAPGVYTVHLTGQSTETGVGLIEVYRLP